MATTNTTSRSRARRTQEQRSTEMRARLLDATIDCLVEYGYAGTTTPKVAAKAGVTRGAQVHHFKSKNDLVIAAIRHLTAKRVESMISRIGDYDVVDDPVSGILEMIWEVHQGPLFVAAVELWIAGRTDPLLAAEMEKFEPVATSNIMVALSRAMPESDPSRELRSFVYTAMDVIRGILISNYVSADQTRARRQWDRAAALLSGVGAEALRSD